MDPALSQVVPGAGAITVPTHFYPQQHADIANGMRVALSISKDRVFIIRNNVTQRGHTGIAGMHKSEGVRCDFGGPACPGLCYTTRRPREACVKHRSQFLVPTQNMCNLVAGLMNERCGTEQVVTGNFDGGDGVRSGSVPQP